MKNPEGKPYHQEKIKFKTEKPYLLVDDFELKKVKQWRSKMEARCEWVRVNEKDNEQSQKDRGKNKKFKKLPLYVQNTRFSRLRRVAKKSLDQVAKKSPDQAAKTP